MISKGKSTEELIDRLSGLYQKDPAKFEEIRQQMIHDTIESFPEAHRKRAYGMQFVIEARLRKYKDPVVRMNKMVEIFWEQFGLFHAVLKDPSGVMAEMEKNKKKTQIIPFRKPPQEKLQQVNNRDRTIR